VAARAGIADLVVGLMTARALFCDDFAADGDSGLGRIATFLLDGSILSRKKGERH
jgi:hypothetical protein